MGADRKEVLSAQAWAEAREIIWTHRARLGAGLGLLIVGRVAGLVLPVTSKYLFDEVIAHNRAELLGTLALLAGVATLVQALASFALARVLGVAAQRVITDFRKNVHAHVSRLPVRFFDQTQTGILISRIMSDAEGIRNLVGTGFVQLVGGLLTASLVLTVLFYLNPVLTAITLLILLVFGGGLALAFRRLRPLFRERGKINAEVTGRLGESLSGIRVVKAYTAEKREQLVFARGAHRLLRNIARTITGSAAIAAASSVTVGLVGIVLLLVGGRAMLAGAMTPGDFVLYVFFTGMLASPVIQIASIGTQISEAFAGLDRIREIRSLATEGEDDRERAAVLALSVRGEVAFQDVSFAYLPGRPVLKHVTFTAPPGTTTALVGPSGSGKSTLASLLMAFNRPQSGTVRIDGRDLNSLKLRDYRACLGVVLQENFLFDGTVAENISFARPRAARAEVEAASQIAHCAEFIAELPQGYDTLVGERGVRLSGGQRQRIAIARAILAEPRILILDEATSSLDSENEALIQAGLRALRRGRTTFVIAHRLSTIRSADCILVLDDGFVVERGTHAELLAREGRYRELYERQYQIETDRFINPGEDFTAAKRV